MIRPFRFSPALSLVLFAAAFAGPLRADVTGFGDNGAGWTRNNAGGTPPVFAADRLTIIQNGEQDTAKSAWFQTPQSITGGFSARFTLRRANTGGPFAREGAAFVIQASAAGTAALGGSGAGLGYAAQGATPGIGSSIGFGFRAVATAGGSLSQFSFGSNGGFGGSTNTSPVDLTLVDAPVQVGIAYDAATGVVRVTLIQNGAVFTASTQSVTFTGSQFVGFTGATGAESETLEIGGFSFGPNNAPVARDDVFGFAGPFVDVKPLANDTDADTASGDTLFIANAGTPRFGIAERIDASTIRYTPGANFPGQDTFTYTVQDFGGALATAVVVVSRDAGAGVYTGISALDPAKEATLNAFASIKLSATGGFTGTILWHGKKSSRKGAFDAAGKFTADLSPNGASPKLTLAVDRFAEAGSLRVTLTDGTDTEVFQARPSIGPGKIGQFNAELTRKTGTVEVGTGWISGKIAATGAGKFAGVGPDGTPFSFSSASNVFFDVPFLSYLYKKAHRGAAVGTLRLLATGEMVLNRPASPSGLYTSGFSERFTTETRFYVAPPAGTPVLPFPNVPPVNGRITLSAGGLANPIAQDIFLGGDNKVAAVGVNDSGVKVKLNAKKGLLTGTFKYPGSNKKTKISGVIFPPTNARGVFIGPATAGDALLATP